jgi:hypothetical protein
VTSGPAALTADRAAACLVRCGRTARTRRAEPGPARRTVPGTRTAFRTMGSAVR